MEDCGPEIDGVAAEGESTTGGRFGVLGHGSKGELSALESPLH